MELFFGVEVAEAHAAGYDLAATFEMFDIRAEMIHLRDVNQAGIEWIVYKNELNSDLNQKIEAGANLL